MLRAEAMEVGGGVLGRAAAGGCRIHAQIAGDRPGRGGRRGGSICRLDAAGAPKVGPESAGADPGPVCYGMGGSEPTITDCNLVLGYLDPAGLAGGALRLDRGAAEVVVRARIAEPLGLTIEEAAHGMLRLAAATMMRAIRAVSVERGRDVRTATLLAFGGNGPLFAAGIAAELGISRLLVPPLPGLFSAFGLLLADTEHHLSRSLRALAADPAALQLAIDALLAEGHARLEADGFPLSRRSVALSARARYAGQSSEIPVPLSTTDAAAVLAALPDAFAIEHERTYGFRAPAGEKVQLIDLALIARGIPEHPRLPGRVPRRRPRCPLPAARGFPFPAGWRPR